MLDKISNVGEAIREVENSPKKAADKKESAINLSMYAAAPH